jgi:hypothetical protein
MVRRLTRRRLALLVVDLFWSCWFFFKKAKEYAPGIVSIITHSAASSTSTPASSTPETSASMPPPGTGAASSAPTSATEPDAEVA